MSDLKLFKLNGATVTELDGQSVAVEKSLQNLIEKHLNTFLGVRFLATEYRTGKTHTSSTKVCSTWTGFWTTRPSSNCWS
jgi:hypothetical protein